MIQEPYRKPFHKLLEIKQVPFEVYTWSLSTINGTVTVGQHTFSCVTNISLEKNYLITTIKINASNLILVDLKEMSKFDNYHRIFLVWGEGQMKDK